MNAPALSELVAAIIAAVMRQLRVSGPGKVLAYDADEQRATVQPLIAEGYYDDDGIRQTRKPAAITNVPVMFAATADGWRQTFPIAVGDTVLLVYADRSLDKWLVRGGEVDPEDDRMHAPSDVIAVPTLRDFAHAIDDVGDNPEIGYPGSMIEWVSGQIRAGGSDALALHSKLTILWNHVNALFTGGTGSAVVPIVGTLGSGTTVLKGG